MYHEGQPNAGQQADEQQAVVRFAHGHEGRQIEALLLEQGLYLAGDTTDHVVLSYPDGHIVGAAMLSRWGDSEFHLEVIGTRISKTGKGLGSVLMEELVRDPWQYCRMSHAPDCTPDCAPDCLPDCMPDCAPTAIPEKTGSVITTVARGRAQSFYQRHGFEACTFDDLPPLYLNQCTECPDRDFCDPVAMIRKQPG